MNNIPDSQMPVWSSRQVVTATLIVVAVVAGFWLLGRFWQIGLLVFFAITLGTALRPLVRSLARRGISREATAIIVSLAGLAVGLGAIVLLVPLLLDQALEVGIEIPDYYSRFRLAMIGSPTRLVQAIGIRIPPRLADLISGPGSTREPLDQITVFFSYSTLTIRGVLALTATFLLAFYWVLESERFERWILLYLPAERRESTRELFHQMSRRLGGYVRGQLLLSGVIAILALIAYLIIGLPYALVLAVVAGIFEVVPVVGPALGAIPAFLVAFSLDPAMALQVILATLVIQGLENYLLVPRIMGRTTGVNPFITLLALAAFSSLLGLPGALLAIPVAAIVQLLLDRYLLSPSPLEGNQILGRDATSRLRYEIRDLTQDIRRRQRDKGRDDQEVNGEHLEDRLELIASDLEALLADISSEGTAL